MYVCVHGNLCWRGIALYIYIGIQRIYGSLGQVGVIVCLFVCFWDSTDVSCMATYLAWLEVCVAFFC